MTKSVRSEFMSLAKKCQSKLESGEGTVFDEVMMKVQAYISALEWQLAQHQREKELEFIRTLSKEEQRIIVNETLKGEVE